MPSASGSLFVRLMRPRVGALFFILLLGAALRLLYITTPLLDAHRWRQIDTAAIARNLYEDSLNPLWPQVDWGGRHGYVESEFPLLPFLVALLYRIFGPVDSLGRLVAAVFSVATIWAVHELARALLGRPAGLAAAFLVAVSPGAVFFGRTFMPDTPMLFFAVTAVLGFVLYCRSRETIPLALGSASLALACAAKIPAVLTLAPIVAAAALHLKRGAWRDRRLMIAVACPLLVAAAWYWHAYMIFRDTGLTFGILAQPAKTYPLTVAEGPWSSTFSKWSTVALLTDVGFYDRILARLFVLHLMPWGFAGAVIGFLLWNRTDGRLIADVWLLAFLAFLLVAGEGNLAHEYYQLPLVVIGSLYFAAAAGPLFDADWIRRRIGSGRRSFAAVALTYGIVGLSSFYYSGVLRSHFRPDNLDLRMLQAGATIRAAVPDNALLVVVDDYGVTSPVLLYFANRKGWSFDVDNLSPYLLDRMARRGVRYFATTVWPEVRAKKPAVAEYLQRRSEVPLVNAPRHTVLFDLTTPKQNASE